MSWEGLEQLRHNMCVEQLEGRPMRKTHFVLSGWKDTAGEFDTLLLLLVSSPPVYSRITQKS